MAYLTVTKELRARWSDAGLFASLFASADAGAVYPLADDLVYEIVNTDVTANKMIAWEWLTGGSSSAQ